MQRYILYGIAAAAPIIINSRAPTTAWDWVNLVATVAGGVAIALRALDATPTNQIKP